MANTPQDLLVSLDIGTAKIVTLVGDVQPEGQINVVGLGLASSRGLKRGVVVDIDATVQAIQESVAEAEKSAGCKINSTFTGIAGTHIQSLNSHGMVPIRSGEVVQQDIDRAIEAAKAVPMPDDQRILHVLRQEFIIDNQAGIREPIGMSGVRLEVKVHIVTGAMSASQNIIKCVQRCGLTPADIILEQLASSYAVLSEDEQELGVCLVDIGGGTTDVAVFTSGAIRHTSVIPIGGDQVTQDLAIALHVPLQHAEQIKLKFGHAFQDLADNELGIDLHDLSEFTRVHLPQPLTQHTLAGYIEPRYEDILQAVDHQLTASGIKPYLGAGIVLTGGGASARGVTNLGEKIFGLPTRVGTPQGVFGLGQTLQNPVYATSVGLLRYGHQQHLAKPFLQDHLGMQQAWAKIKNWFHGYL